MSKPVDFTVLDLFLNCDNLNVECVITIYDNIDDYNNNQSKFLHRGLIKKLPLTYLLENVERFHLSTDGLRCDVLIC